MKHANKVKRPFKYYSSAATARPGYLARRFEQIRRAQKELLPKEAACPQCGKAAQ